MEKSLISDGDYFEGGTEEQYRILVELYNCRHPNLLLANCIKHNNILFTTDYTANFVLLWSSPQYYAQPAKLRKHTFIDFHNMCISVFGDPFTRGIKLKL